MPVEIDEKALEAAYETLGRPDHAGDRLIVRGAIAAYEAAKPAPAGAVAVKPLEWTKDGSVGGHGGWMGRAGMETRAVKVGWSQEEPFEFGAQTFRTLDEAKAAAQQDYEARILSALAHPRQGARP